MAEMRATSFILLLLVVGAIGAVVLVFVGILAIPAFDLGWFKTPEINQKTLNKGTDQILATGGGYTPAKTPNEAMDKFRDAIQNRKYKFAALYTSKKYAEFLERAHPAAAELGADIDSIRNFGKNKGLMTDKITVLLYKLDPFPMNFKVGPAPKEDEKGAKAVGTYIWEPITFKNPGFQLQFTNEIARLDQKMFQNCLAGPPGMFTKIELYKEKENDVEQWKLNIPTNEAWNLMVNHYIERHKTYHTGLSTFVTNMSNERYDTPGAFEREIIVKLNDANN